MTFQTPEFLVYPVSRLEDVGKVFPEPLNFFKKQEFRRYKGCQTEEWWDGCNFARGATLTGSGSLNKGIIPEQRRPTDYHIENGRILSNTEFYESEFSIEKQRHRKSLVVEVSCNSEVTQLFEAYLDIWNHVVSVDQTGKKVEMSLFQSLGPSLSTRPFYAKKTIREYISSRRLSNGPLRHKKLHRLHSIPVDLNTHPALRDQVAGYMASIGGNMRRVIQCRLVRKSDKRFLLCFTFTTPDVIREVINDKGEPSINFCRDPRLVDIGISFSYKGISVVVQNAFEDREFYYIKSNLLKNTAKFINKFLNNLKGRTRSVGMDMNFPITGHLLEVRKELSRRLRTLAAVGATEFYTPPRLVSLGEQYPSGTPFYDKFRLKVWERKLLSGHEEYAMIQGLTGAPCLIKVSQGKLITSKGSDVNPETMANHALLLALAKRDMWHGATFLDRGTCRTVRKGLNRRKEKLQQKTIVLS
jgi:hypothetical protein